MRHYILPTEKNHYRARLLSTPMLVLFAAFLYLFNTVAGTIPVQAVYASIGINDLLTLHNEERKKVNLPPLRINTELTNSAQQKAQAMLDTNCWSHYCPPGVEPWTFFEDAGYTYLYAGENLAEGYYNNEDVIVAWMNSPTHKENILKPEYEEVGFGIVQGTYQGKENNIIIAVHFGTEQRTTGNTLPLVTSTELPKPQILEPRTGAVLNSDDILISGTAPEATQVTLYDHNQEWVTTDASQGVFTYRALLLPEAGYEVRVKSQIGTRNSPLSDTIEFTVDRTPDQISAAELTVLPTDNKDTIELQVNHSTLSELQIQFGSETYDFTLETDTIWSVTLDRDLFTRNSEMTLRNVDLAGNAWSGTSSPTELATQISHLQAIPDKFGLITPTTKAQVNVVSLVILIGLFGLDFIVLARTGITRLGSKSHLHLAILLIVAIIALTGTFAGEVGIGLSA